MNNEQEIFYNNDQLYFDIISKNDYAYFSEFILFINSYVSDLNSRILDLGCGTGLLTNLLCQCGYSAVGVDGSERFIGQAKKNYKEQNFFCENANKMSFDSNLFDVVVSYNSVEHFDNVEAALREMIRVVKPGGKIIINSPNLLSVWQPINAIIKFKGISFEGRNSIFRNIKHIFRNLFIIYSKSLKGKYNFLYRKPEFNFSFPDNDATWYINPVDLKLFFNENGCKIISYQDFSHIKFKKSYFSKAMAFLFPGIMGITRIVAVKI